MRLYIVRHAIAAPHGAPGISDDERPLTEEGIKKMKKGVAGLKALDVFPEVILTSPLPRARETAEIVRVALGPAIDLRDLRALAPGGDREELYQELRDREEAREVMLVGHQPSLGEIAGDIAFRSAGCFLDLKKGGACAIDLERFAPVPRGTLLWLLTPSLLRAIA
jgi:phosphohistidine phosphatase